MKNSNLLMCSQALKLELNHELITDNSAFPPVRFVATPGALALLEQTKKSPLEFLARHLRGDLGDLHQEDKTENELSLKYGFRLLSSYQVRHSEKLWVVTEANRSVTTLLLPEEY